MSGFTPVNQVRLTNVATVRLQKKGKRFEIACYRNKILSWRNKIESNVKEVLQIDTVFTNVSKGMLASSKDLMEAFGTSDQLAVCQEILEKGEMQVSEQERVALHQTIFYDIASTVAEKTINPHSNVPYTTTMIQNAMRQIQYSVNTSKSSKSQALDVIRKLREIMPIARANMLLRIILAADDNNNSSQSAALIEEIEKKLGGLIISNHNQQLQHEGQQPSKPFQVPFQFDVKIDPEHFRRVEDLVKGMGSQYRVEVLQMRTTATTASTGGGSMVKQREEEEEAAEAGAESSNKEIDIAVNKRNEKKATIKKEVTTTVAATIGGSKQQKRSSEPPAKEEKPNNKKKTNHLAELMAADDSSSSDDGEEEEEREVQEAVARIARAEETERKDQEAIQRLLDEDAAEDAAYTNDKEIEEDEEDEDGIILVSVPTTNKKNSSKKQDKQWKKQQQQQQMKQQEEEGEEEEEMSDKEEAATAISSTAGSIVSKASKQPLQQQHSQPQHQKASKKEKQLAKDLQEQRRIEALSLQTRLQQKQQLQQSPTAAAMVEDLTPLCTTTGSGTGGAEGGETAGAAISKISICNTCQANFHEMKLFREHYKSEWHRFNLKRKLKNIPVVTSEAAFLALSIEELAL